MSLFGFAIPKTPSLPPKFSWRPIIILGIVIFFAFGMRMYGWISGLVSSSSEIPSTTWSEAQERGNAQISGHALQNEQEVSLIDVTGEKEHTDAQIQEVFEVLQDAIDVQNISSGESPSSQGGTLVLPDAINLAVPFTSQAPLGIWDAFSEETCEEASLLMALAYYSGMPEGTLDASWVDDQLHTMVDVETTLGFGTSISTAQFAVFAQEYNGSVIRILDRPSLDDLRRELAAGNPVLVPAYGRLLGNPFFTGEGPLYHMLVLRGYTRTAFITNDPGTRHGENYQYSFDVLMQAIGDWDGDSPDAGARVIVLER